jgi:hypothetical protein
MNLSPSGFNLKRNVKQFSVLDNQNNLYSCRIVSHLYGRNVFTEVVRGFPLSLQINAALLYSCCIYRKFDFSFAVNILTLIDFTSLSNAAEDHWGHQDVDGSIILRRMFRNWDVGVWTGLSRLRIETGGGQL